VTLLPPTRPIRQADTHRLIPSRYRDGGDSVLTLLTDDAGTLADIGALENATNDRLLGEAGRIPGIGPRELVLGIPEARVINAAFLHPHPQGSRFNGPDRGAWYAAFAFETSVAEVAHHKAVQYAEIGLFEDSVTYDDYLADFGGPFHDLRDAPSFAGCLAPDDYRASQALAEALLEAGALGLIYPSVRDPGGTCLACFRPALVGNLRRDATWRFTWAGGPVPVVTPA